MLGSSLHPTQCPSHKAARCAFGSILFLVFLVLTALPQLVSAATAILDRSVMREGESVQLIVDGEDGDPDFSVLESNFEVLSSSKNSHINILNGHMNSGTQWILTLMPRRNGDLILPSIRVGKEDTRPLPIRVLKSAEAAEQNGSADVFIEVSATPVDPYVQAQVVYSIKLFSVAEIREGGLSAPSVQNAVIERLGDDMHYQSQRNGRNYQVTERRFAVFPQNSGRVEIGPTEFTGQLTQGSVGANRFADPFSGFFGQQRTRPVRMRSHGITLNVKPKPPKVGNPWLPAQSLTLRESWSPADPQFRVGDSITRTVHIEAAGLTGAQLPPVKMAERPGIKVYADQPQVQTHPTTEGVTGLRDDKFAMVPSQPGRFELPEVRVDWWDTTTGTPQTAVLPARSVEVLPAATDAPPTPAAVQPPVAPPLQSAPTAHEAAASETNPNIWPWIAAFAGLGWMLTAAAWLTKAKWRRRAPVATTSTSGPTQALLEPYKQKLHAACQRGDPTAARAALIAWAAIAWPDRAITNLGEVSEQFGADSLQTPFAQLNAILYAKHPEHWDSMAFWKAVEPHLRLSRRERKANEAALPPLHPKTAQ